MTVDYYGPKACVQLPRAEAITWLNDRLRKTGAGGLIVVTKAVTHLAGFDAVALMAALANYEGFDADNNPHGECEFGGLALWGADLFWKIDYYDLDLHFGSEDPADSGITKRVLTVMLQGEY